MTDCQDFAAAADYWDRLLPQLEAGSEEAVSLKAAIDKARDWLEMGHRDDLPEAVTRRKETKNDPA